MNSRYDTTRTAIFASHDALEREAAELLGRILFAYSRLDMLLGLCIAWAAGGQRVEAISGQVSRWDLNKRLGRLSRDVAESLTLDAAARASYTRWIEEVHTVREERNQMVHGRWGVDTLGMEWSTWCRAAVIAGPAGATVHARLSSGRGMGVVFPTDDLVSATDAGVS